MSSFVYSVSHHLPPVVLMSLRSVQLCGLHCDFTSTNLLLSGLSSLNCSFSVSSKRKYVVIYLANKIKILEKLEKSVTVPEEFSVGDINNFRHAIFLYYTLVSIWSRVLQYVIFKDHVVKSQWSYFQLLKWKILDIGQ